jgi:hypothetical protein
MSSWEVVSHICGIQHVYKSRQAAARPSNGCTVTRLSTTDRYALLPTPCLAYIPEPKRVSEACETQLNSLSPTYHIPWAR